MPPTAVLAGLVLITSYSMSHSVAEVEGTDWLEPVLVWLSICMSTGSGKSALCNIRESLFRRHDFSVVRRKHLSGCSMTSLLRNWEGSCRKTIEVTWVVRWASNVFVSNQCVQRPHTCWFTASSHISPAIWWWSVGAKNSINYLKLAW